MTTSENWSRALSRCQQWGTPHVLLSLISCAGSTPREPGAKMVITADEQFDTIGGGRFENHMIEEARQMLVTGIADTRIERFSLGAQAQQCCGGSIAVLFECYPGASMHISLFGAGNVGISLEHLIQTLPWRLDWYDSRPSVIRDIQHHIGSRTHVVPHYSSDTMDSTLAEIPSGSHCIIMTHDHNEDEQLVKHLVQREDIASIGLIGSKTKWQRFRHRLSHQGISDSQLDRVRCPIGISPHGLKRPEEIALAVAAELLNMSPAPQKSDERVRGVDIATLKELGG